MLCKLTHPTFFWGSTICHPASFFQTGRWNLVWTHGELWKHPGGFTGLKGFGSFGILSYGMLRPNPKHRSGEVASVMVGCNLPSYLHIANIYMISSSPCFSNSFSHVFFPVATFILLIYPEWWPWQLSLQTRTVCAAAPGYAASSAPILPWPLTAAPICGVKRSRAGRLPNYPNQGWKIKRWHKDVQLHF